MVPVSVAAAPTSLVTGGAGFIGSHVADELIRAGHRVVVFDDLSGGMRENVPPAAHFERGDICDPSAVDNLFHLFRFDYVFHLAAYAAVGLSHFIRRHNYTNNVIGSVNLINAAVNAGTVKCFVFTSSISVYGGNGTPKHEDDPLAPEDPYGIAKCAIEQDLRATHAVFGLPYIIFRPHNVYGERQDFGDRYRNVVGIFMNQALRGEPFTIFGDGQQTRGFTHVSDVAPIIARSVTVPGAYLRTMNIGGDSAHTINELAEVVAEAMGVLPRVRYVPARLESAHALATHHRVHEIFGRPASLVSLRVGLARTADWVRRHGPRQPTLFSALEIEQNLPTPWRLGSGARTNR
jgi:UDP-glucose 4-epimerase